MQTRILPKLALILATMCLGEKAPGADLQFKLERSPNASLISSALLDWVFDYAASKGMNVELIIFGYDIEQGEGLWGNATNQNFWIDTLVKRYQDRPNLFMWTVTNEFERYPDGQYSFSAADVQ